MKQFFLVFSLLVIVCAESIAQDEFAIDKIVTTDSAVSVISSFDTVDYLTTFGHGGNLIWEVPFSSKIVSWKVKEPYLFVFSQARGARVFFLTCLDLRLGMLVWEKPIIAPTPSAVCEMGQ